MLRVTKSNGEVCEGDGLLPPIPPADPIPQVQQRLDARAKEFKAGPPPLSIVVPSLPVAPNGTLEAALNKVTSGLTLDVSGILGLSGPSQVPIHVRVEWDMSRGSLQGQLIPVPGSVKQFKFLETDQGNDTNPPSVTAIFHPQIVRLTRSSPATAAFTLKAKVTFSVQIGSLLKRPRRVSSAIQVSAPVTVQTLAIPVLLALFRHPHFKPQEGISKGFMLLVVPSDSPATRSIGELMDKLPDPELVSGALNLATTLGGFALPPGLETLAEALEHVADFGTDRVEATTQLSISNLNDEHIFASLVLWGVEAENEISSLILIGAANSRVELFRQRDFNKEGGQLNVSTGPALVAMIRNLHEPQPQSASAPPVVVPGSAKAVVASPPGHEAWSFKHFGNSISSLKLAFATGVFDPGSAQPSSDASARA